MVGDRSDHGRLVIGIGSPGPGDNADRVEVSARAPGEADNFLALGDGVIETGRVIAALAGAVRPQHPAGVGDEADLADIGAVQAVAAHQVFARRPGHRGRVAADAAVQGQRPGVGEALDRVEPPAGADSDAGQPLAVGDQVGEGHAAGPAKHGGGGRQLAAEDVPHEADGRDIGAVRDGDDDARTARDGGDAGNGAGAGVDGQARGQGRGTEGQGVAVGVVGRQGQGDVGVGGGALVAGVGERGHAGGADLDDFGDRGHALGVEREQHPVAGHHDVGVGVQAQLVSAGGGGERDVQEAQVGIEGVRGGRHAHQAELGDAGGGGHGDGSAIGDDAGGVEDLGAGGRGAVAIVQVRRREHLGVRGGRRRSCTGRRRRPRPGRRPAAGRRRGSCAARPCRRAGARSCWWGSIVPASAGCRRR